MEKKTKVLIGVGIGLVVVGGAVAAIVIMKKKKKSNDISSKIQLPTNVVPTFTGSIPEGIKLLNKGFFLQRTGNKITFFAEEPVIVGRPRNQGEAATEVGRLIPISDLISQPRTYKSLNGVYQLDVKPSESEGEIIIKLSRQGTVVHDSAYLTL